MLDDIEGPTTSAPATPLKVDWQSRCERLAADNVRLRSGVAAIRQRATDLPHVVMPNGDPLSNYCTALLVGPETPK